MTRYFIGFILAVGLIVVVIVLIVRGLSSGPQKSAPKPIDLMSYASGNSSVRLTLDSPVTALQTHNDVIMDVSSTEASLTVTKGYDGSVLRKKLYPMTEVAFATFLRSLSLNGFMQGDNSAALKDERGHCAQGQRAIYELLDGSGNDVVRYWHSTCGSGSLRGSPAVLQQLFISQFPDYSKLVAGTNVQ